MFTQSSFYSLITSIPLYLLHYLKKILTTDDKGFTFRRMIEIQLSTKN